MLVGILQHLEVFNKQTGNLENAKSKRDLLDSYKRWLEESLTVLSTKGYLEYDGNGYTATRPFVDLRDVMGQMG